MHALSKLVTLGVVRLTIGRISGLPSQHEARSQTQRRPGRFSAPAFAASLPPRTSRCTTPSTRSSRGDCRWALTPNSS